jgi:hypothetical protein
MQRQGDPNLRGRPVVVAWQDTFPFDIPLWECELHIRNPRRRMDGLDTA